MLFIQVLIFLLVLLYTFRLVLYLLEFAVRLVFCYCAFAAKLLRKACFELRNALLGLCFEKYPSLFSVSAAPRCGATETTGFLQKDAGSGRTRLSIPKQQGKCRRA